jgi:hypothetical protein
MKDKQTELSFILNENPQQKKSLLYKGNSSWVLENETNSQKIEICLNEPYKHLFLL